MRHILSRFFARLLDDHPWTPGAAQRPEELIPKSQRAHGARVVAIYVVVGRCPELFYSTPRVTISL